ncbi:MAG: helix-turn-helix transcriptional regulator [Bacilli bacterium]|nr:helix-turn-helix transcriptional regulator [Bacilli bacterium]
MSITNQYDIYYIVGKNIKKYRKQKGMTQKELAEKLLLSENFVSKLESDTYQTISIDTLKQFADVLDVKIMCFFDEEIVKHSL